MSIPKTILLIVLNGIEIKAAAKEQEYAKELLIVLNGIEMFFG